MQQRKHSSSQPENFPLDLILVITSGVQQGFIHVLLNKAMLCLIPKQNYPRAFLTNGMESYVNIQAELARSLTFWMPMERRRVLMVNLSCCHNCECQCLVPQVTPWYLRARVNRQPPVHQFRMKPFKPFWGWTKTTSSPTQSFWLFQPLLCPNVFPSYLPPPSYPPHFILRSFHH